jgi:hypothetical protein
MKLFKINRIEYIFLILNVISFSIFFIDGGAQNSKDLFTSKNLFVSTLIITVMAIAFHNLSPSWETGRSFFYKKQYLVLVGQIFIAFIVTIIAIFVIYALLCNIFGIVPSNRFFV